MPGSISVNHPGTGAPAGDIASDVPTILPPPGDVSGTLLLTIPFLDANNKIVPTILPGDLGALASLVTTAFGRGLLTVADAVALKQILTIGVADIVNASPNGRSLISAADYAAMRSLLSLVVGTDVQPFDQDLAAIAALVTTNFGRSLLTQLDGAATRSTIGAQAALGFNPVQQGGGANQAGDKIYIGFDGSGARITINSSDFGQLWSTLNNAPGSVSGDNTLQKLPSGAMYATGTAVLTLNGSGVGTISCGASTSSGAWFGVVSSGDSGASSAAVSTSNGTSTGFDVKFAGTGANTVRVNFFAWGRWK